MVGGQHHTAANHLDKDICGQYLWWNRSMKNWWRILFRSKKRLVLPRKIFQWIKRRYWWREGQRPSSLTLCTAKAKEHHPELEISVLAREVPSSSVFQDNRLSLLTGWALDCLVLCKPCQSPGREAVLPEAHHLPSEPWFSLRPSFLYLSNVSKWYDYISLKARSIWHFSPMLNRWGICNRILVVFVTCLQFVNYSAEIYLTTVQFLFSV